MNKAMQKESLDEKQISEGEYVVKLNSLLDFLNESGLHKYATASYCKEGKTLFVVITHNLIK